MVADRREALLRIKEVLPGCRIGFMVGPAHLVHRGRDAYLFMFKRAFYHNFDEHFPMIKFVEGRGFGFAQIMSKKLLYEARARGVQWLVFMMPDGVAYKCATGLFINFYEKHRTDVPHAHGEIAMPLHYFERIGEVKQDGTAQA